MRSIINSILVALFLAISVFSYSTTKVAPDFARLINARFEKQLINFPQEKVYLQTDKPYYSAGEDIWFKGYLVNASTNEPISRSKFIYVELIDKADSVISRVKIQKDSLGFAGNIKLKPELPSGTYSLRAYTFWMQNVSNDFFFSKNIFIGNFIDDNVSSEISYGAPANEKIPVTLTFTDALQNPVSGKRVEIVQNWSSPTKKKTLIVTNSAGKVSLELTINPNDSSKKFIEASINEQTLKYKNRFFLPEFSNDFDVQFFPESGVLLNNSLQSIAFKAIAKDGLSVEVSGKIFTDKNEEIAEFSTLNRGMGKFAIATQPGESYYAIVKSMDGVEKRFNLPVTQAEGIALHLVFNKGNILYEVVNQTKLPDNSLYLLLHSRGNTYVIQELKSRVGQISESLLPPGIVTFSILDSIGKTYCERLSFIHNLISPAITMESNKAIYGKREPVNMSLKISTGSNMPVVGNFSISITDSHSVKLDSLSDNILSNLLLTSEIKGYIEDPASYFIDNGVVTREKMDVLMMTQGWRRFNTADIVQGRYKPAKYYLEVGQALSGKVLNFFGKPSKKCNITMISPSISLIKISQTDSLGRYILDGIAFPDSSSFIIKAKKPKSITDVEIIPDPDDFPKPTAFIPTPLKPTEAFPTDYFIQSKEKYYYEGGMRVVNLAEVTVKAAKVDPNEELHYYSGMEDSKITAEKLQSYSGMNLFNVLSTIAGVQVTGNSISIRGSRNNPLLLIDDIVTEDFDELSYLTPDDVEDISIFKGANTAIFGAQGGNGVIAITLKKGVARKSQTPISLVHVTPLGYQKPSQFYVPKYEVDSVRLNEKPDLRTTIYWNPKLIADSTGTIHVKFFTADKANTYSIVMEGLTDNGEICRYVGSLQRENQ